MANPQQSASAVDREFIFEARDFQRVCQLIRARAGIALTDSKKQMVYSRLARRLRALGFSTFNEYLDWLEADGDDEWEEFTNALTTNLTSFFREGHHFQILDQFLRARKNKGRQRIWCAAASTGEEPYSLAITACESYGTLNPPVEIVCSDIDTKVLETAQRGVYAFDRIDKMDSARVKRFFMRGTGVNADKVKVKEELRRLVSFQQLNLLDARYNLQGPFDAVFCRNVMIYFDKPTQYQILTRIKPLMHPDGLLFAGHSESFFHASDLFVSRGQTVYERADASVAGKA